MDNQPAFDRSLLIPIFISGFSVIGIVVVLLIGRALNSPAEVPVTPSATRFQYVYVGTEPAVTTPLGEETEFLPPEEEEPFPTEEPVDEPDPEDVPTPFLTTPTRPGALTPIILPSATRNTPLPPTATSVSAPPLTPGTYDDVDSNLVYSPANGWSANNAGGTLHVSTVPGNTVSFRFIGTQLRIRYQGGSSLGQMRVTVDNVSETFSQTEGNGTTEWEWPNSLTNVTHTVQIAHAGGGAVNIDQIIILSPATPTPTPTPTRTAGAP